MAIETGGRGNHGAVVEYTILLIKLDRLENMNLESMAGALKQGNLRFGGGKLWDALAGAATEGGPKIFIRQAACTRELFNGWQEQRRYSSWSQCDKCSKCPCSAKPI